MNTPYPTPRPLDRTGLRVYNLGVQRAVRAYNDDQAPIGARCVVCRRFKGTDHHKLCARCRERKAEQRRAYRERTGGA